MVEISTIKTTKEKRCFTNMKDEILYTAGEIAKIAGVSLRTIRFYDVKGLLKPVSYSEAGYRYYNQESLAVLQKILMLKYLGFSLQQIESIIHDDISAGKDTNSQLAEQKQLLQGKKTQLEQMITTIEIMEKSPEEDKWSYLVRLLNLLTDEEKINEQYLDSSNLEKRIRIHDYSTATEEWMEWVFNKMNLQSGMTILELGCGTGLLWLKNIHKLPQGIHLVLTDRSEGMLAETKENIKPYQALLNERNITIEYQIMDANDLSLKQQIYDAVIANHMLYHVKNRDTCLQTIAKALKPNGAFFCSTVGNTHMKEMHELVANFDSRIEMPSAHFTVAFRLENASQQLEKHFTTIERHDHENDLIVDDADVIYDYIDSYPGNAHFILSQRGNELLELIESKLEKEGAIFIHKSTGMFICKNKQ